MSPFQRGHIAMTSTDVVCPVQVPLRRRQTPIPSFDVETAYDDPFPYYPYMPDHVVIDIGEAVAIGAASAGNCYEEIRRDMAAIVQIFLWACVVHCETLVQFVLWSMLSIAAYKTLGTVAEPRRGRQTGERHQQATGG